MSREHINALLEIESVVKDWTLSSKEMINKILLIIEEAKKVKV